MRPEKRDAKGLVEALRERVARLAVRRLQVLRILNVPLQETHVLKYFSFAIAAAVLCVETVFKEFALRIQLIDNGVCVAALVVRED